MAKWWTVRKYGKYVVDKTFTSGKEARDYYDLACKDEKKGRAIALFIYDSSKRFGKYGSSDTMLYYSKKPLPNGWVYLKYRNVKEEPKNENKTNQAGIPVKALRY